MDGTRTNTIHSVRYISICLYVISTTTFSLTTIRQTLHGTPATSPASRPTHYTTCPFTIPLSLSLLPGGPLEEASWGRRHFSTYHLFFCLLDSLPFTCYSLPVTVLCRTKMISWEMPVLSFADSLQRMGTIPPTIAGQYLPTHDDRLSSAFLPCLLPPPHLPASFLLLLSHYQAPPHHSSLQSCCWSCTACLTLYTGDPEGEFSPPTFRLFSCTPLWEENRRELPH